MPEETQTRYGFPVADWSAAVTRTTEVLVDTARSGGTITYGRLCDAIGVVPLFPRSWALLALINEACAPLDAERGTHLASLVVRASDGMPGEGYFAWAEREGFDVSDRRAMWETEVSRVHAAWSGGRGRADIHDERPEDE